jgi:hypothetical protein
MALIQFSKFDVEIAQAEAEYARIVEADIRGAHGEPVGRPVLTGLPEYVYEALVHYHDEDRKAYEAEIEALRREELGH